MKSPPKPRKTPRQERSQNMVETILDATARVLAARGYAGTNTNLIAERAGVSVGSVYQYFPNKDALIVALHDRHAAQMRDVIDCVLAGSARAGLRDRIAAMGRALLAAHLVQPDLHKVLERELSFFDALAENSPPDQGVFGVVRALLEERQNEISVVNRDLAAWVVVQIMLSLVHAAVIEPPRQFATVDIERAITDAVVGYLTGDQGKVMGS